MKLNCKLPKMKIIKNREDAILALVQNKDVLHVGCVDSGLMDVKIKTNKLLHKKIASKAKLLYGIDVDKDGIDKMIQMGFNNLFLCELENCNINRKFDIIILGEVIEHIDNCGSALKSLRKFANNNTKIVFTTPNAYYYLFWISYLFKIESIHPDHNYLFSFISLKQLIEKFGYSVDEYYIIWEKIDFTKNDDNRLTKIFKKSIALIINIPYLFKYLIPQFGKGIFLISKFKYN